jgi:hypothetical protein
MLRKLRMHTNFIGTIAKMLQWWGKHFLGEVLYMPHRIHTRSHAVECKCKYS